MVGLNNAIPVESPGDLPAFCAECGRRLVFEDRVAGFDTRTGTPRYVAYAYCRGSWLDRVFSVAAHDQYVVSPRPTKRPNPTEPSR